RFTRDEWHESQKMFNLPSHQVDISYDSNCSQEHWFGKDYWVALDKKCRNALHDTFQDHPIWHMLISRLDNMPCHNWQIFQAIKNATVGPEYEAIELYPAQSRLMDVYNVYHLWILAPKDEQEKPPHFPFGCRKYGFSMTNVAQNKVMSFLEEEGDKLI